MVSSFSQIKWRRSLLLPVALLLMVGVGCSVQQREAGEAPEVNVEPGELPEYEVEGPEVDVGTQEEEVTVPEIQVEQQEETIQVPDVDVTLPGEGEGETNQAE